jgi:disulfide bond formation protein DsbB
MCHWQRWAHIAAGVIGLGGGFAVARRNMPRNDAIAWLAIICITVSGAIALYQAGMQAGILPGPSSCTGHRFVLGSHETPQVQCDVVTWTLFGLSLAVYNALASFGIAALGATLLVKKKT